MEEEYAKDLKKTWEILRNRLWFVLLVPFVCTVITGGLSYFVFSPVYEAGTSIIIGNAPNQRNFSDQYYSNSDAIYMYQKLIKTYASIAKSALVADKTAVALGNGITGGEIQGATTVIPETDTQILDIKCQGKDPSEVQKMVNTLAVTFIEESQKVYPTDNIKIVDTAKLPAVPVKPRKVLNMAIAFFMGFIGSVGVVLILEYMDNTVKTEKDIEKFLKLPVLGIIPLNMDKA